jgi:hypothetical protein
LHRLSRGNRTDGINWRAAASLSEYSVIKATDYLSVSYSAQGDSGESVGMNS